MKIKNTLIACVLMASASFAADWALVANPSSGVASVSKADLKRVYMGKKTQLGSSKVVPMMVTESNPAVAAFLQDVLGMSPAEFKKHWVDAQIKGEGTAPASQKTSAAAIMVSADIPGAIAVVEKSAVNASVKEIVVQ